MVQIKGPTKGHINIIKHKVTIIRLPLQLFITYRIHNTQGNDKVNTRLGFLEMYFRDSTGTIFQSIVFNETLKVSVIIIKYTNMWTLLIQYFAFWHIRTIVVWFNKKIVIQKHVHFFYNIYILFIYLSFYWLLLFSLIYLSFVENYLKIEIIVSKVHSTYANILKNR